MQGPSDVASADSEGVSVPSSMPSSAGVSRTVSAALPPGGLATAPSNLSMLTGVTPRSGVSRRVTVGALRDDV